MSKKAKTLDGERTRVEELNLGAEDSAVPESGLRGSIRRWYKNLNLVMAGMYTGLNCYGTPKAHHEYEEEGENSGKPDNRPI